MLRESKVHVDTRLRIAYLIFWLFPMLLLLLFAQLFPELMVSLLSGTLDCSSLGDTATEDKISKCVKTLLFIRMAFAYFLIEFVITLNITGKAPMFGKTLNEEMWTIKVVVWMVLSVLFAFVGNDFF